ncbi:hypothetical protein D3C71_1753300 [compost metagenome]
MHLYNALSGRRNLSIPGGIHHAQKNVPFHQRADRVCHIAVAGARAAGVARYRYGEQVCDGGGVHAGHGAGAVLCDPHARRRGLLQVGQRDQCAQWLEDQVRHL